MNPIFTAIAPPRSAAQPILRLPARQQTERHPLALDWAAAHPGGVLSSVDVHVLSGSAVVGSGEPEFQGTVQHFWVSGGDVGYLEFECIAVFADGAKLEQKLGGRVSASIDPDPDTPQAPSSAAAPEISGIFTEGETLSVSAGTWSGTAPIAYAYQWTRDGANIAGATSSSYELVGEDVGAVIDCTVTATNAAGSASVSASGEDTVTAVSVDETPDAFSFTDVADADLSAQQTSNLITVAGLGSGVSVPVSVSGGAYSKNDGAYTSDADTAQNGDTFRVRHTSSGSHETAANTTLTIGGVSDTFTTTTLADPGDVTAPALSSAADAANGSDAMTGSVDTDEDNGDLYWYISAGATPPSAADLKAGTGATAAGSQTVSAIGTQNISASGLSPETTYYTHYLHRDAAGNDSAIVSADGFTTEAEANPNADYFDSATDAAVDGWTNEWDSLTWVETSSGFLRAGVSAGGRYALSFDQVGDVADFDALVKLRAPSVIGGNLYGGIVFRGGGSAGSETGYRILMRGNTPNEIQLVRFFSGSANIMTAVGVGWVANTWHWMRVRVVGNVIRARLWADGAEEPETWQINTTDSGVTAAGFIGLGCSSAHDIDFDQFSYALGGEPAEP